MSDQESEYSLNGLDLQIRYDESADVLYISFGDPRPGIAVEADSGDLVRVDPYSDQIVGVTLIDFRQKYLPLTLNVGS